MITFYRCNILALLCIFTQTSTQRVAISPTEATYLLDAPENISAVVEVIDNKINFKENYEVAIPTKAGIQINNWNSLIASAKNPTTKNLLFIINPDFFATCTKEEQEFLVTKAALFAQKGISSWALNNSYWIILLICMMLGGICNFLFFRFYKNSLSLSRFNFLIFLFLSLNVTSYFINPKIMLYLQNNALCELNKEAIIKSGVTKEEALSALGKYDAAIKNDLAAGNWFWKPYIKEFENQIKKLKV